MPAALRSGGGLGGRRTAHDRDVGQLQAARDRLASVWLAGAGLADDDVDAVAGAQDLVDHRRLPLVQTRELRERLVDEAIGDDDVILVLAGLGTFDQLGFGGDEVDGGVALLGPYVDGAGDLAASSSRSFITSPEVRRAGSSSGITRASARTFMAKLMIRSAAVCPSGLSAMT